MNKPILLAVLAAGALCHPPVTRAQNASTPPPQNKTAQVTCERLQDEVGLELVAQGASVDQLQVQIATNRTEATPFRVTYSGLRNFTGKDGLVPEANGSFVMNYQGAGLWKGQLAGIEFKAAVGGTDNISLPFLNDPLVLGEWESVDFVPAIVSFNPAQRAWQGKLYLAGLTFRENGATAKPWLTWTRGFLIHHGDKTASRYEIRSIGGIDYLFLEWKSGDVTIAGKQPQYYVFKHKTPPAPAQ